MQVSARPVDVLFFHCGQCLTELSVPVALQGVEGPCPQCGGQIQAPLCPLPVVPRPVYLPPLDRRHEPPAPHTESIPPPDWMLPTLREALVVPPLEETTEILLAEPAFGRSLSAGLLPRQLSVNSSPGFQAKLAIPELEEAPDDSWRARHEDECRRLSAARKRDEKLENLLGSQGFRFARMMLLLTLGGMCAGLVLYLKDRNWIMDLPWKPDPVETVVDLPPAARVEIPPPVREIDPFRVEDASELEALSRPAVMTPIPEALSVPVGAAPIAGKK